MSFLSIVSDSFYGALRSLNHTFYENPYTATGLTLAVATLALFHFRGEGKSPKNLNESYINLRAMINRMEFLNSIPLVSRIINLLKQNPILDISTENGKKEQISLLRVLGRGGCKKAIEMQDNKALILPNMDTSFPRRWKEIVDEEIWASDFLLRNGLLSLKLKKIQVSMSPKDSNFIPAYTTDTFQYLGKNGCRINPTFPLSLLRR